MPKPHISKTNPTVILDNGCIEAAPMRIERVGVWKHYDTYSKWTFALGAAEEKFLHDGIKVLIARTADDSHWKWGLYEKGAWDDVDALY